MMGVGGYGRGDDTGPHSNLNLVLNVQLELFHHAFEVL